MVKTSSIGVTRLHLVESETLDCQFMRTLSYQIYGGASTGEVLRVVGELNKRGNTRENWIKLWTEQGEHCEKLADEASTKRAKDHCTELLICGHITIQAAEYYYESADLKTHLDFYLRGVTCFDKAALLFDFPIDPINIPYKDGVTLPGYFVSPANDGIKRPTIIICGGGGGDSYGEESVLYCGRPRSTSPGV